jgi:hypothetical protein
MRLSRPARRGPLVCVFVGGEERRVGVSILRDALGKRAHTALYMKPYQIWTAARPNMTKVKMMWVQFQ